MAALNQSETKALSDVMATLDAVLRKGYDPNSKTPQNNGMRLALEDAKVKVKMVWTMKGHYPS